MKRAITWINVDQELPDDDLVVLVFIETSDEVWIGYKDGDDWRGTDAHPFVGTVTHWAEMPEGPY